MMSWQYPPFVLFLVLAGMISAALAFYAWQRRPLPGTAAFALLMAAVAEWSLAYALSLLSTALPVALFWDQIVYTGTVTIGPAWLAFALQYTGREKWLIRRNIALLAIIPSVTLALVWTNEAHGLIYTWIGFETVDSFLILNATYGPWFWIHTAYTYVLLLIGTILLLRTLLGASTPRLYRGQFIVVLIGVLAPWVTNILENASWRAFSSPIDLAPFACTLTGLLLTWGLFNFRFLDIIPVARDAVVEGMRDGMIVLDLQGRIVDINPAAQNLIDMPIARVIGQPVGQLLPTVRDVVERSQDAPEVQAEIAWDRKSQPCFYDLRISPLNDRRGRLTGRLLILRNITQQVQAEEELRKHRDHLEELVNERTAELVIAKEQAEAASQAKSTFLANMSHELRTPLNAILGYAQILKQQPLPPDIMNALNIIQRSGEHLLILITDILDISRIEAGRIELRPAPLHLPNFLAVIADIIRLQAETKHLTFTFDQPSPLPTWVQADEIRLRQVLLNLLDNASKFTDTGRIALRVNQLQDDDFDLRSTHHPAPRTPHPAIIRFEVEDTGRGIPPDQVARIFQPFEQAPGITRWTSGTGLGLFISRQLVQLMGGKLQVVSEPGRGSIFWFEVVLPVITAAVTAELPSNQGITGYQNREATKMEALLVPPPTAELAVLHDLARRGNLRALQERAAQIETLGEEYVPFASKLRELAQGFEEREILVLIERYMEET